MTEEEPGEMRGHRMICGGKRLQREELVTDPTQRRTKLLAGRRAGQQECPGKGGEGGLAEGWGRGWGR